MHNVFLRYFISLICFIISVLAQPNQKFSIEINKKIAIIFSYDINKCCLLSEDQGDLDGAYKMPVIWRFCSFF